VEVIVALPGNVGDAQNRTAARAAAEQQGDLVAQVVANEGKGATGKSGGERTRGRLIGGDRTSVRINPLQDHLVLTDVQTLAIAAANRLNADLGRAPEMSSPRDCARAQPKPS
jgi:hypothetical protein